MNISLAVAKRKKYWIKKKGLNVTLPLIISKFFSELNVRSYQWISNYTCVFESIF